MIQYDRRKILEANCRAAAAAILFCWLGSSAAMTFAAEKPKLSAEQMKALAADAVRAHSLSFDVPKNWIEGNVMQVDDSLVYTDYKNFDNPYVRVFLQQVNNELRRTDLLQQVRSQNVMKPYFDKMDQVVAKELAVVEDSSLSADKRDAQLDQLDQQLMDAYKAGLAAVAKADGLKGFAIVPRPVKAVPREIELVASAGAAIDLVLKPFGALLQAAGQASSIQWQHYKAGDHAQIECLGDYYCSVTLDGRQATYVRTIAKNTTKLEFPDP